MSEIKNCPNCKSELKVSLLSSNTLYSESYKEIINEYNEPKAEGYCSKCGKELYEKYLNRIMDERKSLTSQLQELITNIPVVSIHTPLNWDYQVIGMVSGQSSTGTGVLTEVASSFTDFFGAQSNMHNKKLKEGENMCFFQLRRQAMDLGANAVIATDIDYSEIGGGKGMLMVCMAGTAVKLKNIDVIGNGKSKLLDKLKEVDERLQWLSKYNTYDE